MQVITIESQAFQQIKDQLDSITKALQAKEGKTNGKLSDKWLTIAQTCELLSISRRTLQAYRDDGVIPFSQYQGKIYFRATDIQAHLERNYKPAFNSR